ncbi:MAG: hypothetical protein Q9226_006096 [Calogaya cf. arnoldii]
MHYYFEASCYHHQLFLTASPATSRPTASYNAKSQCNLKVQEEILELAKKRNAGADLVDPNGPKKKVCETLTGIGNSLASPLYLQTLKDCLKRLGTAEGKSFAMIDTTEKLHFSLGDQVDKVREVVQELKSLLSKTPSTESSKQVEGSDELTQAPRANQSTIVSETTRKAQAIERKAKKQTAKMAKKARRIAKEERKAKNGAKEAKAAKRERKALIEMKKARKVKKGGL